MSRRNVMQKAFSATVMQKAFSVTWHHSVDELHTENVAKEESNSANTSVSIPSWSLEDRMIRAEVTSSTWMTFFGSSIPLAVIFTCSFVLPSLLNKTTYKTDTSTWIISCFIILQTFVTLIRAIPGEGTSNQEVNDRVNASILISMVLYPCLGLWVTITDHVSVDHLFKSVDESGRFQLGFGYVFPFFLWTTLATFFVRNSSYPFTMDREGVVTDENGKAITALFRRNPSFLEVWAHKITRLLTSSLWSVVPAYYRPEGGGGRFAFQLVAPVIVLLFYISFRIVQVSIQEMLHIITEPEDYTRLKHVEDFIPDTGELARMRLIVWSFFTLHCIIIRGVIGQRIFLSTVVPDTQSFKKRWVGWAPTLIESKRSCVLWAFRGWTIAAVEYYVWYIESNLETSMPLFDMVAYYFFLCVYISFFFEGLSAFFFTLMEAERGCNLKTPFKMLMRLFFWGAFNAYLQPLGTVVNAIFYFINKEYLMDLHLREIFGPLLLTERNTFRFNLPKCSKRQLPTQSELDERLDEWVATWRRKRQDIGRDTKSFVVKNLGNEPHPTFSGSLVFQGSMFPTYHEWLYMRDHYEKYITLLPWERANGPEKFMRWYPSYREEILTLLREPYDFNVRREVWMFGYGSLISPNSPPPGLTDSQRKQIIPYWLKKQAGYCRTWNYRHGPVGINAFGLEKVKDESKNMDISGCIYPMDYEKASDLFSIREEGYELLLVHEAYFEPMHKDFALPKGVGYVWVCGQPILKCGKTNCATGGATTTYRRKFVKSNANIECCNYSGENNNGGIVDTLLDLPQSPKTMCSIIECKRHNPTQDSPILQSYIDTVIEGALRYKTAGLGHTDGMRFAASIVASTTGWNSPWFNDRILSGRPWTFMPNYELIDGLLSTCPTSRDGFINRLRPSIESLFDKKTLLDKEKDKNVQWASQFYGFDHSSEYFMDNV